MREFTDWLERNQKDIDRIRQILSTPLSDEPEELISNLEEIEAWNARAGYLLANANSYLDGFKPAYMPSREGKTELDRKVELDAKMAPIRMVRDTLDSICDSIKQRLILGESILSFHKQFPERKARVYESTGSPWD